MTARYLVGDVHEQLATLPDNSVDLVLSSPPFLALRSYLPADHPDKGKEIGSEPTPGEFLDAILDVVEACARVLTPHGSLVFEFGDSFAGSGGAGGDYADDGWRDGQERFGGSASKGGASNWSRPDAMWLAGVIDTEGCITVRHATKGEGNAPSYSIAVQVQMMDPQVVDRAYEITGVGHRSQQKGGIECWQVVGQQARYVLLHIWPHLLIKQRQALAGIELQRHTEESTRRGQYARVTAEQLEYRAMIREYVSGLNARGDQRGVYVPTWEPPTPKKLNLPEYGGMGWPLDKSLSMIPQSFAWALAYGRNPWTGRETDPWRIRNFCPWVRPNPPVGALCVDDQTEALTPDGWKRHDQLTDGDLIAAYDPSRDSCRFVPAKFVRYEREGEPMVEVEKRSTSQRMTLDHRVWTRTRKTEPHVRLARDLTNDCDTLLSAPLDDVPGPAPVTTERAALLGWFVAEGTPHSRQARIIQSLTANPQKVETIRALLERDGADWRETVYQHQKGSDVVTFHVKGELAEWLNLHHKRLPMAYVTTWPEAQARALFDALVDGDGHRRKDGRRNGILFHQKDEPIADAVQVLGLRLGYRATKTYQPSMRLWQITMGTNRWTRVRKWDGTGIPRTTYTGTVWCPMVETGLWLARRNGRPFVTGNSDKFRPGTSYLTVACKSRTRWFDLDAVRTEHKPRGGYDPHGRDTKKGTRPESHESDGWHRLGAYEGNENPAGAPPLDWFNIPTQPYPGSHYATWSSKLVLPFVESMCPRQVCVVCGEPRRRIAETTNAVAATAPRHDETQRRANSDDSNVWRSVAGAVCSERVTLGWSECEHPCEECHGTGEIPALTQAGEDSDSCTSCGGIGAFSNYRAGVVLDPFAGSGTTLQVATGCGRDAIGIDLDARNLDLARERIGFFLVEEEPEPPLDVQTEAV